MPKFRVELIREVTDLQDAWVTVEADSEEEAEEVALVEAEAGLLDWAYRNPLGHGDPEVNCVLLLREPAP